MAKTTLDKKNKARSVSCLAPAKINLALHITGRRSDGYHTLESLVVFFEFGDRLTLSAHPKSDAAPKIELVISGRFTEPLVKLDQAENLVLRAAEKFLKTFEIVPEQVLHFELQKNLPIASGIGGGSANAAAALILLAEHFDIKDQAALTRLGAELGADIPMCLASQPLIAKGIGEILEPLTKFPSLSLVLVNPSITISTPEVFTALKKHDHAPLEKMPQNPEQLIDWLARQRNDLFAPALKILPRLEGVIAALNAQTGVHLARMSGSGATCFGIFDTIKNAKNAARQIAQTRPQWWVQSGQTLNEGGKEFYDRVEEH